MKKLAYLALTLAVIASPALADTFSAELVKPKGVVDTVLEDVAWRCQGAQCMTTSDTGEASARRSCAALVREVGPVTLFSAGSKAFTPEQLALCNGTQAPAHAKTTP